MSVILDQNARLHPSVQWFLFHRQNAGTFQKALESQGGAVGYLWVLGEGVGHLLKLRSGADVRPCLPPLELEPAQKTPLCSCAHCRGRTATCPLPPRVSLGPQFHCHIQREIWDYSSAGSFSVPWSWKVAWSPNRLFLAFLPRSFCVPSASAWGPWVGHESLSSSLLEDQPWKTASWAISAAYASTSDSSVKRGTLEI